MNDSALIIGAGIGGLTTGALLAQRGWRVIILEQSSRIGGCCSTFSRAGFTFDAGATLFPDILWSGLDLVTRELGLDLDRIFVEPFSQICIPRHRIGLYRDFEAMKGEWAREFPREKERINALLHYLYKIDMRISSGREGHFSNAGINIMDGLETRHRNGFPPWSSFLYRIRSTRKLKHAISDGSRISAGFDLQTLYWGQVGFDLVSLAYAAMVIGLPMNGGFCLRGGSESLCRLLAQYIREKGGEIRLKSPVRHILTRKGKAVGLELGTDEAMEGRCYIANTTPWVLYEKLLSDGSYRNRMIRRLRRSPFPKSVFTLFLGVKEDCLPSHMGHKVFFFPEQGEESDQTGPLFITLAPKEDMGRAPAGSRALTVFHYTASDGWERGKGYEHRKEQMTERALRLLKRLIPFLDEGLCFSEAATPLTYERFTARPGGIVNGAPRVFAPFGNKALSESIGYSDLFLIGDCVSPGLGVEGICQASLHLVDRICKRYE
jgi:phytoene dehydrogenase-like protein